VTPPLRAVAWLTAVGLLAACSSENRPSPRDPAAYYAVDVQFCDRKLDDASDTCDNTNSVHASSVFANVVVGYAGRRVVQVEMDGPKLGTHWLDPVSVPAGQSLVQWFEIGRSSSCLAAPCTVAVNVYIDGEFVLTEAVSFV
jgi:hypothetical protein